MTENSGGQSGSSPAFATVEHDHLAVAMTNFIQPGCYCGFCGHGVKRFPLHGVQSEATGPSL